MYNRRTKQAYDTSNGQLKVASSVSSRLFKIPSYEQSIPAILEDAPSTLRVQVENILRAQIDHKGVSDEVKILRAKKFVELSKAGEKHVLSCVDDPSKLDEMHETLNRIENEIKAKAEDDPSFLKSLLMTVGAASLNNVFPGLGLLLAAIPAVAAIPAPGTQVVSGTPQGGLDLCGGNIYCHQGYIAAAEDTKSWFGQFSVTVSSAASNGNIDLAFLDCLSLGKVGDAISPLYQNATMNSGSSICFANSQIFHGTTGSVQGTNLVLPNGNCGLFQQQVNPVFNQCVNYSSQVGMWIGVGFACAIGLAGLITLAVCCIGNSRCCNK